MAKVTSLQQLLITCLRDLREGEEETLKRFPAIIGAISDGGTVDILQRRLNDAARRAEELDSLARRLGTDPRGEENIWMGGMVEDAEGDMKTEEPGPLLDLALIGAVRKMVNASLVSYETAIAVADRLQDDAASATFTAAREQEQDAERALRTALFAVAGAS